MTERRPQRRGLFWSAVLLALGALVGGSLIAYVTYAATAGPDGAVKGYFAALARGDAPAALGFGDLPAGPHDLLTSRVLREQHRIAPMRRAEIITTDRVGDTATVTVQYRLDFADASQQVADDVTVVLRNGSWRLTRTAASTQLRLLAAGQRATIVGGAIPDAATAVFPGAIPITFDTPYLRLADGSNSVPLSAGANTDLAVEVTAAGRSAVDGAVFAALRRCLAVGTKADLACPLPTSRAVPGSLRGNVSAAGVRRAAVLKLAASSAGVIMISGKIKLTGSYAALDFENQPVGKRGTLSLPLAATAYATDPITVTWAGAP